MSEAETEQRRRIIAAAIRFRGSMYLGTSHAEIRHRIAERQKLPGGQGEVEGPHGFVTDKRVFLPRTLALLFAVETKQVHPSSNSAEDGQLYSDDLRPLLKRTPIARKK